MLASNFVKFLMPIMKWGVDPSPNFVSLFQFHERLLLCTFLTQTIYTLLNKSSLKWTFLRLTSAQVKILSNFLCQFWNDELIPLQILYPTSVSWKTTPLYSFSSNNIYFAQKKPIKMKILETYQCSGQNFSNFLCQYWNSKPIPVQIFYPSSV